MYLETIAFIKAGFQTEASEALAKVAKVEELTTQVAEALTAAEEKGFEEGLAQAGQANGEDKLYSDAEVNKFIAEAKAPLLKKIEELEAAIVAIKEELVAAEAHFEVVKAEAVAAFKAELLAKYEEQQKTEAATEVQFAELLK